MGRLLATCGHEVESTDDLVDVFFPERDGQDDAVVGCWYCPACSGSAFDCGGGYRTQDEAWRRHERRKHLSKLFVGG